MIKLAGCIMIIFSFVLGGQKIALARKENLGMSLNEIGKIFGLSRSGIYHRLKKICDIAEKL